MKKFLIAIVAGVVVNSACNNPKPSIDSNTQPATGIFPKGNAAPASNFTGKVWVQALMPDDTTFHCVMGSVTFSPGARSNWHTHPAGQILIITSGVCYTQQKGKPIEVYHTGEVVKCPPNVEHWHGASPDSGMTHLSINPNAENGVVTWLQPVTDAEYSNLRK